MRSPLEIMSDEITFQIKNDWRKFYWETVHLFLSEIAAGKQSTEDYYLQLEEINKQAEEVFSNETH